MSNGYLLNLTFLTKFIEIKSNFYAKAYSQEWRSSRRPKLFRFRSHFFLLISEAYTHFKCSKTNINKNQHKHSFDYSHLIIQSFTNRDYFFRHSERYYIQDFSMRVFENFLLFSHIHGSVIQKLH